MNYTTQIEPSIEDAKKIIMDGLNKGDMITIVGRCQVDYDGRTSSFLPPGDRLIMRKQDGNFLVHKNENRKPVNWQPKGASCTVSIEDDTYLKLHSETTSPDEVLNVKFDKIYTVSSYNLIDNHEIEKYGTEEHIQDFIFNNEEFIEEGFTVIDKERKLDVGAVDIFGKDKNQNPTIVEIKRRKVGPEAVQQLHRYVEHYSELKPNQDVKGILVAPEITDSAESQLQKYGFKLVNTPKNFINKEQKTQITDFS